MSILLVARGNVTLGMRSEDCKFNFDPAGGSIAVAQVDPATIHVQTIAPAKIFGDWQTMQYSEEIVANMKTPRGSSMPPLKDILRRAYMEKCDSLLCDFCHSSLGACRECVVSEWKNEFEEEGILDD